MTPKRQLTSAVTAGLLVLALAGCGGDTKPEATGPAGGASTDTIEVKDFAFKPDMATVKAGTKVTWVFKDGAAHNVAPKGASEPTKSPDLKDGATYSFTFTKPGMVEYFCGIHEYMTGSVMVTA